MRISIALCTYNGEKFLGEQLDSFAAQTMPPDEIIVCDDCSTDETREFLTNYANNSSLPVKLIFNERNLGYVKNFEKAIRLCTCDIIFLSDQDDVWHESKIEKFVAEFESDEEIGMVFCDGELVDENLKTLGKSAWQARRFDRKKQAAFTNGNALRIVLNNNVISGCMMAFRAKYRDFLLPIPNDIPGVIHDYWIAAAMLTAAKTRLIPQKLVKYRQHGGQQLGLSSGSKSLKGADRGVAKKNYFEEQKHKFENFRKHLTDLPPAANGKHGFDRQKAFEELEAQLKHISERTRIVENPRLRALLVARELISRRYHRYSNGWMSAATDLLLYF